MFSRQCRQSKETELGKDPPIEVFGTFDYFREVNAEKKDESEGGDGPTHDYPLIQWMKLVERYSRCKLTYEKDKLIAFSALSKAFQTRYKLRGRYLAGIWEDTLPAGLLWDCSSGGGEDDKRATIYRAPSWSWASLDCLISPRVRSLPSHFSTRLVTIIDISVITESDDPFGMLADGYLIMEACLIRSLDSDGLAWEYHWHCDVEEERNVYNRDSLVFVPLATDNLYVYGLTLTPVTHPNCAERQDGKLQVFRRVGMFRWYHEGHVRSQFQYRDAHDEFGVRTGEIIWPDPRHPLETIKII